MHFIFYWTVLIIGCLQNGAIHAAFDVELKSALRMQQGLGWPHVLTVVEGHEALMKLTVTAPNQESCTVLTPSQESFDVASPPSRYEAWGSGCGLRVHSVQAGDFGRWRLTSSAGNQSFTGWIEVYVEGSISSYEGPPILLMDGQQQAKVDLTSLDNSYCLVAQPFSQSSLVPGHCQVTLDKATRAVQGNWNIVMGLPGRVKELHVDRQVTVEAERLHVGFIHDTAANKIHLYCNILNTNKNITFCRFQKTTASVGYNIMEGLSDGVHSYYGDGFVAKECGLTIEKPEASHYGTWRCSVGSQQWVGNNVVPQTPMQALINIPAHLTTASSTSREGSDEIKEMRTILVQKDLSFTIMCNAHISLSYCWFLHPNGTQFSPVTQTSEDQLFWYTGESLQSGDCGITFKYADESDAGDWVCHMGAKDQLGLEETDEVNVRVTGPLAAYKKQIGAVIGQNVTITCHTANGNRPLEYCRFLSPQFIGFNLDAAVTVENAIMGRFYFTPNLETHHGDCSLSIISVQEEDIGEWTCAALINNEAEESSDTAVLYAVSSPLSRAGIVGMAVGLSFLFVILGGVVWYKFGMPVPKMPEWNQRGSSTIDLGTLNYDTFDIGASGRSSMVSNNSSDSGSGTNKEASTHRRNVQTPTSVNLYAVESTSTKS